MKTSNKKYEITDIVHETYPFLHRVRALRDIGENVKAGDLGGFVEGEHNLETELSGPQMICAKPDAYAFPHITAPRR